MGKLQALGINSDSEGAMFNLLGLENPRYLSAAMTASDRIESYIKENGYHERTGYFGLIMDVMAEVFASGVETGRRLERSPIIDALYTTPGAGDAVTEPPC